MFQTRYGTRDVVKNFSFDEATEEVMRLISSGFRSGHLFTTQQDLQLDIGKRNSLLRAGKPTFTSKPVTAHDRKKKTFVDPNAFYLKALGIATDDGRIRARQQDKWRQINKFVEILAGLVGSSPIRDKADLKIVDMGSGKGYLTFAAYDYLVNLRQLPGTPPYEGGRAAASADGVVLSDPNQVQPESPGIQMTGVEQRRDLVELCNDIAKAGGFDGLRFVQGTIAGFEPGEIDILIALHACDTATDDALYKGVAANASIIIAAPCCHKELRRQIAPPEILAGILKHGVMLERTAETLTDGIRSLLLEGQGYSTKLFEFVPTEHTPKNNMLVATKKRNGLAPSRAARQITELRTSFGIREQRLEKLLSSQTKKRLAPETRGPAS